MESTIMEMKPPELNQQRYRRPPSPPMFDCGPLLLNDLPLEPAPAFPPAPAILDDSESNMLDDFFTTMNSNTLDGNDFWFNFNDLSDKGLGGNYHGGTATSTEPQGMHDNTQSLLNGFEWPDESQPSFGLAAALPSPPPFHGNGNTASMPSHQLSQSSRMHLQKQGPPSSDVVEGASMLYHPGPAMPDYPPTTYHPSHAHLSMDAPRTKRARVDFDIPHQQPSSSSSTITPPPSSTTNTSTSPKFNTLPGAANLSASDIYFQHLSAHHPTYNQNRHHHHHHAQHQQQPQHQHNDSAHIHTAVDRVPLRWGSDASFSNPRYAAPPDQPSLEDRTRHMLKHLDCLETTQSSAGPTRASSPTGYNNNNKHQQCNANGNGSGTRSIIESPTSRDMMNLSLHDKFSLAAVGTDKALSSSSSSQDQHQHQQQQQQNNRVTKRRRSAKRAVEYADDDDQTTPTQQSPKYRRTSLATPSSSLSETATNKAKAAKASTTNRRFSAITKSSNTSGNNNAAAAAAAAAVPTNNNNPLTTPYSSSSSRSGSTSASASASASRRRSSAACNNNKVLRENLSEEQKRANHILSEQKRRDLIKNGFEDLCRLVPKLKGGGFSKSMMLVTAAEWLEEVVRGNEVLKGRIVAMDDGGGGRGRGRGSI